MSNRLKEETNKLEYDKWLASISFVDKAGEELPVVLAKDDSDDPDNDRAISVKED